MRDQTANCAEMDNSFERMDKISTAGESHLEQEWYESDLQLAAELGKTLLERNKDLENSLKQQQQVIEDKTLEIEYLTRQTTSLREVNESRLKVYEQLEISLQELEKTNQKLQHESNVDKKKIRSMCGMIESLERKCDELQKSVDELRAASQQQLHKRRERRRTLGVGMEFDAAELRRVMSVENGLSQRTDERHLWDAEKEAEYLRLQQTARELKTQKSREQRLREELELEMACMMQENEQLREQLDVLKQQEVVIKALQMELQEMEEEYSSHQCCNHRQTYDSTDAIYRQSSSILDNEHEVEDGLSGESIEHCALVKLHNGGQAYGSQEALVSVGKVIELADNGDDQQTKKELRRLESSLLSELDAQYRLLIEKYEAMVNARRLMELGEQSKRVRVEPSSGSGSNSGSDLDDAEKEDHRPQPLWSNAEESSSLSSGFSDADVGQAHKSVQTDIQCLAQPARVDSACSPPSSSRSLAAGLRSRSKPFENHFSHTPEYKKLFQEIFAVLKKTISYENEGVTTTHPSTAAPDAFPALPQNAVPVCQRSAAGRQPTPDRSYADVVNSNSKPFRHRRFK